MSRKKIKNPLIKRIPKEIIGDWKKYLVVFLFLVLTIGFVSGMYVANDTNSIVYGLVGTGKYITYEELTHNGQSKILQDF